MSINTWQNSERYNYFIFIHKSSHSDPKRSFQPSDCFQVLETFTRELSFHCYVNVSQSLSLISTQIYFRTSGCLWRKHIHRGNIQCPALAFWLLHVGMNFMSAQCKSDYMFCSINTSLEMMFRWLDVLCISDYQCNVLQLISLVLPEDIML